MLYIEEISISKDETKFAELGLYGFFVFKDEPKRAYIKVNDREAAFLSNLSNTDDPGPARRTPAPFIITNKLSIRIGYKKEDE